MRSLKSRRLKPRIKGSNEVGVTIPVEVLLVELPWLVPGLPPWFLTPALVLDMVWYGFEKMHNQRKNWKN